MSETQITTLKAVHPRPSVGSLSRADSVNDPVTVTYRQNGKYVDVELPVLRHVGHGSGTQTPHTPEEAVAEPESSVDKTARWRARVQYAVLCYTLFTVGWSDGTTGPLLPRIQNNYHVSPSSG